MISYACWDGAEKGRKNVILRCSVGLSMLTYSGRNGTGSNRYPFTEIAKV